MSSGKIHAADPFEMADTHSNYMATLTTLLASPPVMVPAVPVAGQRAAFSGRGAYCYQTADLISQFGSIEAAVSEMQRCHLNHIWVRVHGYGYVGEAKNGNLPRQKQLIIRARAAGIAVGGWGWCQGVDPKADASLAHQAMQTFDLEDYIADIEQGVNGAKWTEDEVAAFVTAIRPHVQGLCVSSHGFIDYQEPRIFRAAGPQVDCFNPQAYWFTNKPNPKMLKFVNETATKYPLSKPEAYVRLCYDRWTQLYGRPLVMSGHTAPELDMSRPEAEAQLRLFLQEFDAPAGLVGLNYWHWGATSRIMRDDLAQAQGPF